MFYTLIEKKFAFLLRIYLPAPVPDNQLVNQSQNVAYRQLFRKILFFGDYNIVEPAFFDNEIHRYYASGFVLLLYYK